MKMKKIIALTLAAAMMTAAATGCGNKAKAEGESGDAAAFDASSDITVVSREDGSGTRGAFVELFKIEEKDASGEKIDYTTEEANITNSTSVMMSTVAGDDTAIGYVSLGSLDDSVKVLKIDGTEATPENVKNSSYKISRPFNIVVKEGVPAAAQDFIDFIMSTEGQKIVEESGYIAVDDVQAYAGTKPEGKIVIAGSSSVTPVMEKLQEAYTALGAKAEIEIQQSDSTTGVTATVDGVCDIGMVSRDLTDSEAGQGLTSTAIAIDGIAVVVNSNNTLEDITSDNVKAIFTGEALTWDEVIK